MLGGEAEEAQVKQEIQGWLEEFNKVDRGKQGSVRLAEALRLIKRHLNVASIGDEVVSKVIFNVERQVSFDQFLALLHEAELAHAHHNRPSNLYTVEFLKLLEDYRRKCEESSLYLEAEKAHQKVMEVKDKEMRRQKQKLLSQQKSKVVEVNSLQQSRLLEFNSAWNDYMEKYEGAAINSIEKLKAKHLREMEDEEQRIKNYLEAYLKPSKKVIDLRSREKLLVKQRDYSQAEKIKLLANRLESKEKEEKSVDIADRVRKRKEALQKHQEIALLAHLKRIQKDRNQQLKQREVDSQKMLMKLKNMQNDLVQKQSVEIKQTLQNLRETMCLTSGLFRHRKSADKLDQSRSKETVAGHPHPHKNEKKYKIRVNSFHRVKLDQSIYDP